MIQVNSSKPVAHLSATGIAEFLQCPKKFALRRVHNCRPSFRPIALAVGTAWHEAVGRLLYEHSRHVLDASSEPSSNIDIEPYTQCFRDSLRRQLCDQNAPPLLFDHGETEGDLVTKAIEMLNVLVQKVPLPARVHAIEQSFQFEIIDPPTSEVLPIPFVGSIDAIVAYNDGEGPYDIGAPVVWELKTGARRWDENKLLFDFQPTAYRVAARELGLEHASLEVIVTTKTRKPDVQRERLVRTKRDEAELMTTAASVYRALQAGCEHPIRGWQCKTCPFAEVCS